jgi:hypothetical protein
MPVNRANVGGVLMENVGRERNCAFMVRLVPPKPRPMLPAFPSASGAVSVVPRVHARQEASKRAWPPIFPEP